MKSKTSTFAKLTMLRSWPSTAFLHHCPRTLHHLLNKLMSVSKGGNNIGLVWRKLYRSERCQFQGCCHHPLYYCITLTRSSLSCLPALSTIPIFIIFNTLPTCAARVTVICLCVCLCVCVCYHVFCHHTQQTGQRATPAGSAVHWLHFKNGDFRKNTAF